MMRFLPRSIALLTALLSLPGAADEGAASLDELFAKVDAKAEGVRDLRAEFRQEKKMKIRRRPLISTGTLSVQKAAAGSRICWESWEVDGESGEKSSPQRLLVLGDEGLLVSWEVETLTGERTDLGKGKLEVSEFLTIGGSLSGLKKSFTVSLKSAPKDGAGYVLALVPHSERLKRLIETMELEIDPKEWVVTRIRVADTAATVTEIFLAKIEVNAGVDAELFRVPADVKLTDVSLEK